MRVASVARQALNAVINATCVFTVLKIVCYSLFASISRSGSL